MSDDSLNEAKQTKVEKVAKVEKSKPLGKLSSSFSKLLFLIITVFVTATVTWYVNYRLNHLEPIISITNIEFFFDLEGQKELIEIPNNLIESDRKGFFGMGLKHFMTLEDLGKFTEGNRIDEIKKRYRLFEKEIDVYLNFLREKPPVAKPTSDHSTRRRRSVCPSQTLTPNFRLPMLSGLLVSSSASGETSSYPGQGVTEAETVHPTG